MTPEEFDAHVQFLRTAFQVKASMLPCGHTTDDIVQSEGGAFCGPCEEAAIEAVGDDEVMAAEEKRLWRR